MTKNELIKQQDLAVTYSTKFKETPIAQGLIKHGNEKLVDKILSNFYFICRKNQATFHLWDKSSVVESLTKCCQWELIPDAVQACLVPYKDNQSGVINLTFQPMYQGLLEMAYRTGIFKSIAANVVYEGDEFDYDIGGDCFVKHKLDLQGKRNKPIAVYADVRLTTGGRFVKVMTMSEVNKIQNSAKNKKIWASYTDAMRIKTAIKQIFKLCPKSEGLADLVSYDNSLEQEFEKPKLDTTKTESLNELLEDDSKMEIEVIKEDPQNEEEA